MKKILFFTIVPVVLLLVLIFLFVQYRNNLQSQKGALQVTSEPQSRVYLDDKYIGTTPLSKTEVADMIQSGDYYIRLVPMDANLAEYQEKITISKGVLTVLDRKFSKGGLSEGSVISLNSLPDKKRAELEVVSFPPDAKVELDSNGIGNTPVLYKQPTESDHLLKISRIGYNEKTVRIRNPKGYRLRVIAYLAATAKDELISPTMSQSLTPSPMPDNTKVIILDTPTGFLRVRESYGLNSAIITTVNPGDTFPLINEQPGWFEIKLGSSSAGWVSSQYAKKE